MDANRPAGVHSSAGAYGMVNKTRKLPKNIRLIFKHLQRIAKKSFASRRPFSPCVNVKDFCNNLLLNHFPPTLFSPPASPIYEGQFYFCSLCLPRRSQTKAGLFEILALHFLPTAFKVVRLA